MPILAERFDVVIGVDTHKRTHTAAMVTARSGALERTLTVAATPSGFEQLLRPDLLEQPGVGPIVASIVLSAWSHPGRIHSEGAFAMIAGCAPIPASSGQTTRHRLNRQGDRQLNWAIHVVYLQRMRRHEATKTYITRRRTEGKTSREIRRCVKRYIARELFQILESPLDNQ